MCSTRAIARDTYLYLLVGEAVGLVDVDRFVVPDAVLPPDDVLVGVSWWVVGRVGRRLGRFRRLFGGRRRRVVGGRCLVRRAERHRGVTPGENDEEDDQGGCEALHA